jgi:colicin import membrane protein
VNPDPTPPIHAAKLAALLKKFAPTSDAPRPAAAAGDPIATIIQSFLLWEASSAHAAAGMDRIAKHCVDFNELRVCQPEEIVAILPSRYPFVEERSDRLRRVLNDLYRREHRLSLDHVAGMAKREQRAYLENLDGMLGFVSARVLLLHFQHSLVPCDDQLVDLLVTEKALSGVQPSADVAVALAKAAGSPEEAVKLHLALVAMADLAWEEDAKSVLKAKQARLAAIEAARREARREAEAKARAEAKAIAAAEAKARREIAAQAKAEEKARAKAKADAEAAKAKAKADAEAAKAKARAEAEAAKAKARAEAAAARAKAQAAEAAAKAKAKAEAEAKAAAAAKAKAQAKEKAEAEAKRRADAKLKSDAKAKTNTKTKPTANTKAGAKRGASKAVGSRPAAASAGKSAGKSPAKAAARSTSRSAVASKPSARSAGKRSR